MQSCTVRPFSESFLHPSILETILSLLRHWALDATAAKSLQSCPTLRPHRWQPTRLLRPWDSPGKNTGVGCHFLLQCMKVKSENEVTQSCLTLRNPMDCSLAGSSVHGSFHARVLEWVATECISLGFYTTLGRKKLVQDLPSALALSGFAIKIKLWSFLSFSKLQYCLNSTGIFSSLEM